MAPASGHETIAQKVHQQIGINRILEVTKNRIKFEVALRPMAALGYVALCMQSMSQIRAHMLYDQTHFVCSNLIYFCYQRREPPQKGGKKNRT